LAFLSWVVLRFGSTWTVVPSDHRLRLVLVAEARDRLVPLAEVPVVVDHLEGAYLRASVDLVALGVELELLGYLELELEHLVMP
jgi:hypothetical protein